jgi:hypothetical protein
MISCKECWLILCKSIVFIKHRVNANQTKSDFEKEKNKIYQNISEAKSRLDDVQRKAE